jgi:hypothetical protein
MRRFYKTVMSEWGNKMGAGLSMCTLAGAAISEWVGKNVSVPPGLLLAIGFISLVFVLVHMWRKADRLGMILKMSLETRCRRLIKEWSELAVLNGGDIVEPLSPTWRSAESRFIPFRVGELQGLTNSLMMDVNELFPKSARMTHRPSFQEMLIVLNEYRDEIKTIV